jgi:hypothetical protein
MVKITFYYGVISSLFSARKSLLICTRELSYVLVYCDRQHSCFSTYINRSCFHACRTPITTMTQWTLSVIRRANESLQAEFRHHYLTCVIVFLLPSTVSGAADGQDIFTRISPMLFLLVNDRYPPARPKNNSNQQGHLVRLIDSHDEASFRFGGLLRGYQSSGMFLGAVISG